MSGLAAPTLTVTSGPLIHLSWTKVTGAQGYGVLRGLTATGPFVMITPQGIPPSVTTFDDPTALPDVSYYYQVIAGQASDADSRNGSPSAPSTATLGIRIAGPVTPSFVMVSPDGTRYRVYMANGGTLTVSTA